MPLYKSEAEATKIPWQYKVSRIGWSALALGLYIVEQGVHGGYGEILGTQIKNNIGNATLGWWGATAGGLVWATCKMAGAPEKKAVQIGIGAAALVTFGLIAIETVAKGIGSSDLADLFAPMVTMLGGLLFLDLIKKAERTHNDIYYWDPDDDECC